MRLTEILEKLEGEMEAGRVSDTQAARPVRGRAWTPVRAPDSSRAPLLVVRLSPTPLRTACAPGPQMAFQLLISHVASPTRNTLTTFGFLKQGPGASGGL